MSGWTEEHFHIFAAVQEAIGNRKVYTEEERDELKLAQEVDKMVEAGEEGWLDKVSQLIEEGYGMDEIPLEELYDETVGDEPEDW